jgi:hypothetical protein
VAVVTGAPVSCSGAAYSGVMRCSPVRVRPALPASSPRSLAMPKSSSFTRPLPSTRMLLGLRSRCTTLRDTGEAPIEERVGARVLVEQHSNCLQQVRVPVTRGVEERLPLRLLPFERIVEQRLNPRPPFGVHGHRCLPGLSCGVAARRPAMRGLRASRAGQSLPRRRAALPYRARPGRRRNGFPPSSPGAG